VCVLLDESDAAGARVCVPMKVIDAPLACTDAATCASAGFPVDAACVDELCTCAGDAFDCDTGTTIDATTCRCVFPEPDAGE
jgi:hypothetical protein